MVYILTIYVIKGIFVRGLYPSHNGASQRTNVHKAIGSFLHWIGYGHITETWSSFFSSGKCSWLSKWKEDIGLTRSILLASLWSSSFMRRWHEFEGLLSKMKRARQAHALTMTQLGLTLRSLGQLGTNAHWQQVFLAVPRLPSNGYTEL